MRGVGVEKAAAVGAEMLDGLERGDRSQRDRLLCALERPRRGRCVERLRFALLDQQDRQNEGYRHEHARGEANKVAIEITEIGTTALDGEGANKGHRDNEACRCGGEHRKGDRRHLTENRK